MFDKKFYTFFLYSGKTEFQTTQQNRARRSVQFERKPSQRYARRQSHVLRERYRWVFYRRLCLINLFVGGKSYLGGWNRYTTMWSWFMTHLSINFWMLNRKIVTTVYLPFYSNYMLMNSVVIKVPHYTFHLMSASCSHLYRKLSHSFFFTSM
jgi:hypothetical protein